MLPDEEAPAFLKLCAERPVNTDLGKYSCCGEPGALPQNTSSREKNAVFTACHQSHDPHLQTSDKTAWTLDISAGAAAASRRVYLLNEPSLNCRQVSVTT
ncbi:hypothetical protein Baya_12969 [Bagarius yarrelli]|uniref:Uncharacterized protein n=1 Tax=Bagarius yarrelli TaxID=175774 RepID=A0A556V4W3_BAGYA|nr:hypothetical protein Baya_12969 [Bagarius yarrelli]